MQVTERREGPLVILALEGRLDHAGAGIFQEHALKQIEAGTRSLLVDFGGTTFVASMGIRALIVPAQEMSRQGGRFALTGLSPELRKLFEMAGLLKVFTVYPDVAGALADGTWA